MQNLITENICKSKGKNKKNADLKASENKLFNYFCRTKKGMKPRARRTAQHLSRKGNSLTIHQGNSNKPDTKRFYINRKARSPLGILFISKKSCSITPKILMRLIIYLIIDIGY